MALVDYIFIAEFDIDKGSSLRHALPAIPEGYDGDASSRIAELMLPDGAHNRLAESTTFMLRSKGPSASQDDPAAINATAELRCFSIARTRIDASRRRHADLKAIAIGSRMPFADMFRPALAAALDCYFNSPTLATLQGILAAFNSLDVSGFKLPSRTERTLLRGVLPLQGRSAAFLYPPSLPAFLAGADAASSATAAAVPTAASAVSPSAAAAAVAVAAATGEPIPAAVTGSLTEADAAAAAQREAHWFWSPSFTLTFPAPATATATTSSPSAAADGSSTGVVSSTASDATTPTSTSSAPTSSAAAPVPVPVPLTFRYPRFLEPAAFHSAPLAALLRRFGDRTVDIMAAVLLEKRVLFLGGRDVPAADVCACVLATAHMVCPPLSGAALSRRLYPYANLTDLSFLDTKGYIAGVTNPLFETKRARFGEQWLRQAFQAHAAHWVQLAGLHELIVGGRAGRARTSTFGSALSGAAAAAAGAAAGTDSNNPFEHSSTPEQLKPLAEGDGEDGPATAVACEAGDSAAAAVGVEDAATGLASPDAPSPISPAASAASSSSGPASVGNASATGSVASGAAAGGSWQPLRSRADSAAAAWTSPIGGRSSLSFGAGAAGGMGGMGGIGGLASPVHRSYPLLVSAAQRAQVLGASARLRALAATSTYEVTRRERASEEMSLCLGEQPMLYTYAAPQPQQAAAGASCAALAGSEPAGAAVSAAPAGEAVAPADVAGASSSGPQPVDCALLRSIARLLRQPGVLARTAPDCEAAGAPALAPSHAEKAVSAAAGARLELAALPLPFSPACAGSAGGAGASVAAAAVAITGLASAAAGAAAAAGSSTVAQLASDIAALLRGKDSSSSNAVNAPAAAKPTVVLAAEPTSSVGSEPASAVPVSAGAHTSSPAASLAASASQAPCPLRLFTDLHASLRGNPSAQIYFLACLLADGSLPATGDVGGSSVGNGIAGGGEGGLGIGGIAGGSPGLHPLASAALHASPGVRAAARAIMRELACHPWLPVRAAVASTNSELLRAVRHGHNNGADAVAGAVAASISQ